MAVEALIWAALDAHSFDVELCCGCCRYACARLCAHASSGNLVPEKLGLVRWFILHSNTFLVEFISGLCPLLHLQNPLHKHYQMDLSRHWIRTRGCRGEKRKRYLCAMRPPVCFGHLFTEIFQLPNFFLRTN